MEEGSVDDENCEDEDGREEAVVESEDEEEEPKMSSNVNCFFAPFEDVVVAATRDEAVVVATAASGRAAPFPAASHLGSWRRCRRLSRSTGGFMAATPPAAAASPVC